MYPACSVLFLVIVIETQLACNNLLKQYNLNSGIHRQLTGPYLFFFFFGKVPGYGYERLHMDISVLAKLSQSICNNPTVEIKYWFILERRKYQGQPSCAFSRHLALLLSLEDFYSMQIQMLRSPKKQYQKFFLASYLHMQCRFFAKYPVIRYPNLQWVSIVWPSSSNEMSTVCLWIPAQVLARVPQQLAVHYSH